ncbi:MAG: S-methyl-5'-thioadenosine phosphorylase [Methanomassiliicoccales archaeon]|nr:S-methyl-5'-thioadenosine phosphorylase [Methanomassiliicoccales archaeon]
MIGARKARTAVIGGTGVYDTEKLEVKETIRISTPFGEPSGEIQIVEQSGILVAFLPRHGKGHIYPPHSVNYRANIWALKQLGVQRIVSPCAVGSLQEKFKPGEIVVVDQFIDFTKRRDYTFYDGPKTIHISAADPFCPELRDIFMKEGRRFRIPIQSSGTYVCVEGPRFSTRAESRMFRDFGDVIGMTLVPECQLALEQEMCYLSLAMITDYDVWADKPVDAKTVLNAMAENVDKIKKLVTSAIPKIPAEREKCRCSKSLESAGA